MRNFLLGLICGLAVVACAATFPYRHYGLDAASYDGNLLGPESKDDLPLRVCAPDDQAKGKCVVLLTEEFFRMKQDYLDTKQRLIDCERNR